MGKVNIDEDWGFSHREELSPAEQEVVEAAAEVVESLRTTTRFGSGIGRAVICWSIVSADRGLMILRARRSP